MIMLNLYWSLGDDRNNILSEFITAILGNSFKNQNDPHMNCSKSIFTCAACDAFDKYHVWHQSASINIEMELEKVMSLALLF